MVDQKEQEKLTVRQAWAKRRDAVNPMPAKDPNWTAPLAPYKERQRTNPPVYLIAVSERLREYQTLYGRSALSALKILETAVTAGLGPVVEDRTWAWKMVMSDRKTTLKDRAAGTLEQ